MLEQPIKIRFVNKFDLNLVYEMICALEKETLDFEGFEKAFIKNLSDENVFYWLAEKASKPAGFISLHLQHLIHHAGLVAEIQEFFVWEAFRGQGVGKTLMDEAISYAKSQKVKSIEVSSNKKRVHNVAIYEQMGFSLTHNKLTIGL